MALQSFDMPLTDADGKPMPTVYKPVSSECLHFIMPAEDEDGNVIPPTIENLSKYQGQADWIG